MYGMGSTLGREGVRPPRVDFPGSLPGFARDYDCLANVAEGSAELLDRLRVRGEDAVGWSDDGVSALILAACRPELLRRPRGTGGKRRAQRRGSREPE
jgi:hypothetical protein